ncbi:MAG: hypothetical protein A3G95_04820 [Flavobacteria bacterium RIFCSPLOWO2_12_FULL_31_7]|nr:MAG: hypothetical protein A3G95_04820 [Flavobacteria bacterium RIFCSPLOWO2_12_FULL_31_7]
MKNLKIFLFGLLVVSFVSCTKDDEKPTTNVDSEMVSVNITADFTSELDFNTGIDLANNNSSYSNKSINEISVVAPCATITVNNTTPGVFPKVFTIDFGTGCTQNGITRSGILTITLSGYVMNNGSTMTIERNNYYVNLRKIDGTVVYTNETTNVATPQWSRTVTNGQITLPSGGIFTHSGTRTVRQTAGVSTAFLGDNIYEVISGTHTVNRPNGSTLTSTILEPLIKKYACNYISQGKLNLQGTVLDGVLDYGNNECDNLATYFHNPNGQTYNVTL